MHEIRFRVRTDDHDLEFKARAARKLLNDGRVRVSVMFRGREITHPELATAILTRFCTLLDDVARVETPPKMQGRMLMATLAPKQHPPAAASRVPRPRPPRLPLTDAALVGPAPGT